MRPCLSSGDIALLTDAIDVYCDEQVAIAGRSRLVSDIDDAMDRRRAGARLRRRLAYRREQPS